MNENMDACTGSSGISFSITGGSTRIQEKIDVVQQVVTLLEDTMSSAKSTHQKEQSSYQSKIDELESQIQNLRNQMQKEKEDFIDMSASFEDGIQKYLNLENKLITIKERSHDDYVVLPELDSRTDTYVARFLPPKYNEYKRLKSRCQFLNQVTHTSFRDNIGVRRYKVSVESVGECSQFTKAMEKANALNLFRGKKSVITSPVSPSQYISLTWSKDEIAAGDYVQRNYRQIVEQVIKEQYEEYRDKNIEVTELLDSDEDSVSLLLTNSSIHVQAKASSTFNAQCMPRRITLFQFDESTISKPPALTTFSVETALPAAENVNSELPSSSIVVCSEVASTEVSQNSERGKTKLQGDPKRKRKKHPERLPSKADVFSLIGLNDTDTPVSCAATPPSEGSLRTELENDLASIQLLDAQSVVDASENTSRNQYVTMNDADEVNVNELVCDYMRERSIEKLTEIQKETIRSFKKDGDVLYEGVANGGKTTGMVLALLNCIDPGKDCIQALVITPNARSSKLVQKAAEFIGERQIVLCQRVEQLLDAEEPSKHVKIIKQPASHILVGTLEEMKAIALTSFVRKDTIRFLILHKAEEIYGSEMGKQKERALLVNQVLYALNATVKVIVVRRTMTKCPELDTFCERKLRHRQFLNETVDMAKFLNNKRRSISGGNKPLSVYSQFKVCEYNSGENEEPEDESDDTNDTEEAEWRTLITEKGMHLLGISKNVGNDGHIHESEDVYNDIDILHLYAKVENDDTNKIDVMSLLNLEEDNAIIFCDSVEKAEWISTRLRQRQLWPQVLHENVSPKDQRVILQNYRQGNLCRLLICTDFLTSISLDSADIVLNYNLPKTKYTYLSRAAFAVRRLKNYRTPSGNRPKQAVVANLIVNEFAALKELEVALGIAIKNCEAEED